MSVNYTKSFIYNLFIKTKEEFQELDIQDLYKRLSKKDIARIPAEIWNNLSLQQLYESSVSNLSYLPLESLLFLLNKYQHINESKEIMKKVDDKIISIQSDIPRLKIEKALNVLNSRQSVKRENYTNKEHIFRNDFISLDKCCYYMSVTEKKKLRHLDKETNEITYLPLYERSYSSNAFTTYEDLLNFVKLCREGDPIEELPERLETFSAILQKTNILNRNISQITRYLPHYRLVESLRYDYNEVRDIIFKQQLKSFQSSKKNIDLLEEIGRIPKAFAYYYLYDKMSKKEFNKIIEEGKIELYQGQPHLLNFSSFFEFYDNMS